MPLMPFQVLGIWLRGLFALLLVGVGGYLLYEWYTHRYEYVVETTPLRAEHLPEEGVPRLDPGQGESTAVREIRRDWQFGLNRETAWLLLGSAMIVWAVGGRWLNQTLLTRRRPGEEPKPCRPTAIRRLPRPDGSELYVELHGPLDGPPLVFIHGWGQDSAEWRYAQRDLSRTHLLIMWDLPGLGRSTSPANKDWSLETLAGHLHAVLELAQGRPAVIVGHSIGGMIALTYCKVFPEAMESKISGLVLAHSTYTNPVRTTAWPRYYAALQKPILEPLCHLMIWLAPVVWVMNWLSYFNGSAHRSTDRSSFSGGETRGQLNFVARYTPQAWPGVVGRGFLAMFRYDATETLRLIRVPALVVAADQDQACTLEASEKMSREIPAAALVTLESARHCGHFEHHGHFNSALQEFLTSSHGSKRAVG